MKKWIAIGTTLVLGVMSSGLMAQSVEPGQWGGPAIRQGHRGRGAGLLALLDNPRVKAYLNLTDPQVDQLRQIAVESQKVAVKNRAEVEVREIELRELLRADQPDREAIMKKLDELSSLRGNLMKQRVEALLSARSVLTPEQQKKVRSFLENREGFGMRGERPGERPGGWGPPSGTPRGGPAAPARPAAPPVE